MGELTSDDRGQAAGSPGEALPWWRRRSVRYHAPLPFWLEIVPWLICGALLWAAYLALLHPYWLPASDSDFYLALARNIAQGEGFWHNGNPVGMMPPGWPLTLAAGMQLTAKLALLKLVNSAALLLFFGVGWWVLRRAVGWGTTAVATLLTGFAPVVVEMNWFFLSDPIFAALSMLCAWSALRAGESENRRLWGWTIVCALLAMLATSFRWTGILLLPLVGAALFHGRAWWRPGHVGRWASLAIISICVLGAFFALRQIMEADQRLVDLRFPPTMVGGYPLVNTARVDSGWDYVNRVIYGGFYISGLLWWPLAKTKLAWTACGLAGNALLLCCVIAAADAARRRHWLLLGAIGYCLPIVATWPSIVPRYLLAAMPLVLAGSLVGLRRVLFALSVGALRLRGSRGYETEAAASSAQRRLVARGFTAACATVFVLGTLAVQGSVYSMEMLVAHGGGRFNMRANAGIHRMLPSIARELLARDVQPGEVAVSEFTGNRTFTDRTHGWMRALTFLLDRPVRAVPIKLSRPLEKSPETLDWLRQEQVRYYVYLPRVDRTLHFRGGRLEEFVFEGRPIRRIAEQQLRETDWLLYEIDESAPGGFRVLPITPREAPKVVPQL